MIILLENITKNTKNTIKPVEIYLIFKLIWNFNINIVEEAKNCLHKTDKQLIENFKKILKEFYLIHLRTLSRTVHFNFTISEVITKKNTKYGRSHGIN